MKKLRLEKKNIIVGLVVFLFISNIIFSAILFSSFSEKLTKSENNLIKAEKIIENNSELNDNNLKEIEILRSNISIYEENTKKLEDEIKLLNEENAEVLEYLNNILTIPGWSPNDVTASSNVNETGLKQALKDTGLEGLEESFIKAEEEYGINAIFLTSLVALESGWGESNRAITQNNLSGYAVYEDHSVGKTFSSKHESVMLTAKLLKNDYISEGRYDIDSINKKYSVSPSWASKIQIIAKGIIEDANIHNYIKG